jgi:hypothetical protein
LRLMIHLAMVNFVPFPNGRSKPSGRRSTPGCTLGWPEPAGNFDGVLEKISCRELIDKS